MEATVFEFPFVTPSVKPLEDSLSVDEVVMEMTGQSALLSPERSIAFFFSVDKLTFIGSIFSFVGEFSVTVHESVLELSSVDVVIPAIY